MIDVCDVCTARFMTRNICVMCDNDDDDNNVTYSLEHD